MEYYGLIKVVYANLLIASHGILHVEAFTFHISLEIIDWMVEWSLESLAISCSFNFC